MTKKTKEKLTAVEGFLVDDFLDAALALPKSICIELNDFGDDGEPTLTLHKRVGHDTAVQVAALRKKSLRF